MKSMKRFLFALTALTAALTAAPAAAEERIVEYFYFSMPPPAPTVQYRYCYTENGHWTWDGVQYVWMPSQTVCRTEYR